MRLLHGHTTPTDLSNCFRRIILFWLPFKLRSHPFGGDTTLSDNFSCFSPSGSARSRKPKPLAISAMRVGTVCHNFLSSAYQWCSVTHDKSTIPCHRHAY